MSDICHRCGACCWGVKNGLCEDCRDDIKRQNSTGEVKEAEGVELLLDEGVMIDLMERYEENYDWNMYYFALEKLFTEKLKAVFKTQLNTRLLVDLSDSEKRTIREFEAGSDAEGIILYVEELLALQKSALKSKLIARLPKVIEDTEQNQKDYGLERIQERNEAIAEFTKDIEEVCG
jgi:hypothetical protein